MIASMVFDIVVTEAASTTASMVVDTVVTEAASEGARDDRVAWTLSIQFLRTR